MVTSALYTGASTSPIPLRLTNTPPRLLKRLYQPTLNFTMFGESELKRIPTTKALSTLPSLEHPIHR
ncbi:hypothetical protein AC579_5111 [Pseudocercospora musae]|uniref:Uncharacterized protein n=1 Tax=Pseudocercospora musae TaxID=113226 RepID=A0A139IN58_9PEZI|nr:hypothetical protein AC579_5111 [Pseudocercospora musae]